MDRPSPRRESFDTVTMGWGSDKYDDLRARIELTHEFRDLNGPLNPSEAKVLRAMEAYHVGQRIARGELEPQKASGG